MTLRSRDGVAGYVGLQHCGSVWACPVCSARILQHRSLEIGAVLGRAVEQGHPLGFVTLTMRHNPSDTLESCFSAVATAWSSTTSGKTWARNPHVTGWVRVWEVTHGRNGWHVHAHIVLVLEPETTSVDLETLCSSMFGRWSRSLVRQGFPPPLRRGQDWQHVASASAPDRIARYLTDLEAKSAAATSLGLELTHTQPGRSRAAYSTSPVWSLLDHLHETGEIGPWREWERASKGRRQVGWSKGLRDRFAPDLDDLDDQAVVDQVLGDEDDDLLVLSADSWRELVSVPDRIVSLLEAAESSGLAGAASLLDSWRIRWSLPASGGPLVGGPPGGAPAPRTDHRLRSPIGGRPSGTFVPAAIDHLPGGDSTTDRRSGSSDSGVLPADEPPLLITPG